MLKHVPVVSEIMGSTLCCYRCLEFPQGLLCLKRPQSSLQNLQQLEQCLKRSQLCPVAPLALLAPPAPSSHIIQGPIPAMAAQEHFAPGPFSHWHRWPARWSPQQDSACLGPRSRPEPATLCHALGMSTGGNTEPQHSPWRNSRSMDSCRRLSWSRCSSFWCRDWILCCALCAKFWNLGV